MTSERAATYAELKTQLRDQNRDVLDRLVEERQRPPEVLAMLIEERGMPEPQALDYLTRLLSLSIFVLQR